MRLFSLLFVVISSLESLAAESCRTLNATSIINVNNYPNSTLGATAWSLIYTYPTQIFANFAGGVLESGHNVTVNQIAHQRNLASVGDPGVIKPNVDTLYSRVVLDLSSQDVVLTVPNITDGRYWNYPVLDFFGNVQAEIGIVNGNKPGNYLIRRSDDAFVQPGFRNASGNHTTQAQYEGIVNLPTTYGTMLIRLLLRSNTSAELATIHAYQNASLLTPVNRQTQLWRTIQAPALNTTTLNGSFLGIDTPAKQFAFAAKLLPFNQPENYTDRYRVATILARAGLYNGAYHPVPGVNLTVAGIIANQSITADVETPANKRSEGNGWELQIPSYQGNYGTNYGAAAYVALQGYQQQTVRQTLYPGWEALGFTTAFSLPPNGSLLVTFSGKPKLKSAGFWSLTAYGDDQYLIPNIENRFEVGDRTDSLTYVGGEGKVYGNDANSTQDGPFQILLQDATIQPPQNWTGNWLPVSKSFSWIARWYVPEDAMTNGSYIYPVVQNISVIRDL